MPLVPTKNMPALISYYLGVACLIPGLGCVLAIPALICGILGAVKANSDKQAGGMGHAITGIALSIVGPWVIIGIIYIGFFILSMVGAG